VREPNISPWRRAVSDLTSLSILPPGRAGRAARRPCGHHGRRARTRKAARAISPQPHPSAPEGQPLPTQAAGIRPACPRAIGWRRPARWPQTPSACASGGDGLAGVFHVYDRLRLDAIPRRYTVEPGKALEADWALEGENGAYDLFVLGPAGFHRAFVGHRGEQAMLGWQIAGDVRVTASAGCGWRRAPMAATMPPGMRARAARAGLGAGPHPWLA
jgi:phospholipase C